MISQKKKERNLFETLFPHRRLYSKVVGNRRCSNSSNKTPLRVRLQAPGNWCRECRERNKVTQQITRNCPAPLNWSGVLSHLLREREPEFKVVLRIEGIAQDVILKDEWRMVKIQEVNGQIKKWLTHEIYSGRSGKTRKLCEIQRGIQSYKFMKWATSSCTSWDRYPEPSRAIHACSTCRRD